jgi:hypothetical protein
MALYTNQTGKLKEVKEKPFKLEKDIQKVFEENLSALKLPCWQYWTVYPARKAFGFYKIKSKNICQTGLIKQMK